MPSLDERLETLRRDLLADPPRINAYDDLPFAIFQYDPASIEETEAGIRGRMQRLKTQLDREGKQVEIRSLGLFLWEAIRSARGLEALFQHEAETSFRTAADVVAGWLSDESRYPLADKVAQAINAVSPRPHVVFLYRAGVFAPDLTTISSLLRGMHRKTSVPTVLFYPGTREGEWNLRYMGLTTQRDLPSSYHVRIY